MESLRSLEFDVLSIIVGVGISVGVSLYVISLAALVTTLLKEACSVEPQRIQIGKLLERLVRKLPETSDRAWFSELRDQLRREGLTEGSWSFEFTAFKGLWGLYRADIEGELQSAWERRQELLGSYRFLIEDALQRKRQELLGWYRTPVKEKIQRIWQRVRRRR